MTELYLTRKEFLALPVEERRKILEKQANNEGILKYYRSIEESEFILKQVKSASNSCEAMYLD
jgi:ATP-dependent DNA ligase